MKHYFDKNEVIKKYGVKVGFTVFAVGLIFLPSFFASTRQTSLSADVQPETALKDSVGMETKVSTETEIETKTETKTETLEEIENMIHKMSLEEKILQLFIVTPEALAEDSIFPQFTKVTEMTESLNESIRKYPVGGFIYFQDNLMNPEQVTKFLQETKSIYEDLGLPAPFLSLDEEGGTVSRIGSQPTFGHLQPTPLSTQEEAYTMGTVLVVLGFNLDFAPVCDVVTNPENTVIGDRSYGSDPVKVSKISQEVAAGLREAGVIPVLKHFPGHGSTSEDSHKEIAVNSYDEQALYENDLPPFMEGIQQNCEFIMVGHIAVPNITGTMESACFSKKIITELLREELQYENLIITDALNMKAVTNVYTSGEAAVKAIQAGIDILLMPENFTDAYLTLLETVKAGIITEERIDESVRKILLRKISAIKQ